MCREFAESVFDLCRFSDIPNSIVLEQPVMDAPRVSQSRTTSVSIASSQADQRAIRRAPSRLWEFALAMKLPERASLRQNLNAG